MLLPSFVVSFSGFRTCVFYILQLCALTTGLSLTEAFSKLVYNVTENIWRGLVETGLFVSCDFPVLQSCRMS